MKPDKALFYCELIADYICPKWRSDGDVRTNVPNVFDHQTQTWVRKTPTEDNFTSWGVQRNGNKLIRNISVSWKDKLMSVRVQLDHAKCPVQGTKVGSTAHTIYIEVMSLFIAVIGQENLDKTSSWVEITDGESFAEYLEFA